MQCYSILNTSGAKLFTESNLNFSRHDNQKIIPLGSEFPQSILSSRVRLRMLVTTVKPAKIERGPIFIFDDFFFVLVWILRIFLWGNDASRQTAKNNKIVCMFKQIKCFNDLTHSFPQYCAILQNEKVFNFLFFFIDFSC